jgi:hypothetical protein
MSSPATATSGWYNPGKVNKSLAFDGTNDYVNLGNPTSLQNLPNNDFTVSAWIKDGQTSSNTWGTILSSWTVGQGWLFRTFDSSGSRYLQFDTIFSTTTASYASSVGTINNSWNHVVAVWNASNKSAKLYINGAEVSYQTQTPGVGSYTGDSSLNKHIGTIGASAQFFKGLIDEPKIFTFALTPEQVRQEYNLGTAVNYSVGATESASLIDGPGNDPVAYWNFEERSGTSTTDKSGNNNTGTLTNSPTWTAGKIGSGLNFSPTNSYVSVADATALNITGDITVEAWVKPNVIDSTSRVFLEKGDGASAANRQYALRLNSSNRWEFFLYTGSTTNSTPDSTTTPSTSRWDHVVGVRSGNTISVYVNGVFRNSTTVSGSTNTSSSILALGKAGAASGYFGGQIDEVKIYNYARTRSQIAYDYNRGAPVAWYKFDECQGTVINDSSGVNGNATLNIGASGTQSTAGTCSSSGTAWANGSSGKFNSGMNFDGTDDDITSSNVSAFPTGANPRTISFWVYPTATTLKSMFGYGSSNNLQMFDILLYNGIIGVHWNGNTVDGQFSHMNYTLNAWNHVVFTYDGTVLRAYMNGVLRDSVTVALNTVSSGTFKIGNGIYNNYNYFGGKMDDIRVYNYTMSAAQVRRLYNNDQSVFYGPATGSP